MKNNADLRQYAKENHVKLWQIAAAYGVNDGNFSRKLRKEFTDEQKEKFIRIVDSLKPEEDFPRVNLSPIGQDVFHVDLAIGDAMFELGETIEDSTNKAAYECLEIAQQYLTDLTNKLKEIGALGEI